MVKESTNRVTSVLSVLLLKKFVKYTNDSSKSNSCAISESVVRYLNKRGYNLEIKKEYNLLDKNKEFKIENNLDRYVVGHLPKEIFEAFEQYRSNTKDKDKPLSKSKLIYYSIEEFFA